MTTQAHYSHGTAGAIVNTIAVTSPATSSVMVLQGQGWSTANVTTAIVSIADNASGGTNVWKYSTVTASQKPPANGSYSTAHSQYGFSYTAWCLPSDNGGSIKPFTSLVVTLATTAPSIFQEGGVGEYTGMPANTVAIAAASNGTIAIGATSYTTPALAISETCLVVCSTSCFDNPSAASSGWVLDNDGNPINAHNLAATAGAVSCTFTMPADDTPSSTIVAFGPPPGNPKAAAQVDTFNTNDLATAWANTFGTVAVSAGRCSIQTDTSYSSALVSSSPFDLTGSYIFARLFPYQATSSQAWLQASADNNNKAILQYSAGQVLAVIVQSGVSTQAPSPPTYDPVAHAWMRIRESTGTVFFDTSPDGITWNNLWSYAGYGIQLTAASLQVVCGDFGSDATGTSFVTDFNAQPVPAPKPFMTNPAAIQAAQW